MYFNSNFFIDSMCQKVNKRNHYNAHFYELLTVDDCMHEFFKILLIDNDSHNEL
jgi:hypothetical protein